jgi:signal peptidase
MAGRVGTAPGRRHPVVKAVQWVLAAVVIVLVVLALSLAVSLRHSANGETTLFGRPIFSVDSGSMSPTFNTGDLIIDNTVSATAVAHLHKGQIITFQATPAVGTSAGLVITHRIYAVLTGQSASGTPTVEYRTKGDANNAPDVGLVTPSAILGLYQGQRIPFGGYALNTLHQPITFVVLIMIVVVYVAEELIRKKWVDLGEQEARRKQAQANREGGL